MEARAAVIPGELSVRPPDWLTPVAGDPMLVFRAFGRSVVNAIGIRMTGSKNANDYTSNKRDGDPQHRAQCTTEGIR